MATDLSNATDWDLQAALASGSCTQADPEAFFPEQGQPGREARRVCRSCPVRAECLEITLRQPIPPYGLWAGLNPKELRPLRQAREQAALLATIERLAVR
jgi:hypothetical protein